MDPVRVGLLGCGSWGPRFSQILSNSPYARLIAVADVDVQRAEVVAAASGVTALSDPEKLCRMPEIEAVFVVTPTPNHAAMVNMALEAGKHVLVEKPMAPTLAEAQAMVTTAETSGRSLMVGQIVRFMPATSELRVRIARGEIGRPTHVVERRYGKFRVHAWPEWWKQMDGFLLLHLGSHSVDAILWVLGIQAEWAFAQGFARLVDSSHGAIDAFSLTLGLEGQVLAGLHHEAAGGAASLAYNLLVVGETGRLELDEFTTVRLNGTEVYRQQEDPFQPALQSEIKEFANAIRENRPPLANGREVLPTVACLEAARRSLHSRQMESVAADSIPQTDKRGHF